MIGAGGEVVPPKDAHTDVAEWIPPQKSSKNAELVFEDFLQGISDEAASSGAQIVGRCAPHDPASDTASQEVPTINEIVEPYAPFQGIVPRCEDKDVGWMIRQARPKLLSYAARKA